MTTTTKTTKTTKPQGITSTIVERLLAGVPKAHILEELKATFPGCKTNLLCIGWVASHLRTSGALASLKQHKLAKQYADNAAVAGV